MMTAARIVNTAMLWISAVMIGSGGAIVIVSVVSQYASEPTPTWEESFDEWADTVPPIPTVTTDPVLHIVKDGDGLRLGASDGPGVMTHHIGDKDLPSARFLPSGNNTDTGHGWPSVFGGKISFIVDGEEICSYKVEDFGDLVPLWCRVVEGHTPVWMSNRARVSCNSPGVTCCDLQVTGVGPSEFCTEDGRCIEEGCYNLPRPKWPELTDDQ